MNFRLFILLFILNFTAIANASKHTTSNNHSISLPDNWVKSTIGELFYNTEIVLTDTQSSDMLIVASFPGNLIITKDTIAQTKIDLINQLSVFNSIASEDVFYDPTLIITEFSSLQSENSYGSYFVSKNKQGSAFHYSWIGTVKQQTLFIKIISKTQQQRYTSNYFTLLLNGTDFKPSTMQSPSNDQITSEFYYQINSDPDVIFLEEQNKDSIFSNTLFYEADRLSRYTISTQCSGIQVPDELLMGVIMKNYGHDNEVFNGFVNFRNNKYYTSIAHYKNSKGKFNVISSIINEAACQHVISYIVENKQPLVPRFMHFLDLFEIIKTDDNPIIQSLPESKTQVYTHTLISLADAYFDLKVYQQALKLYQQAFAIQPNIDRLYSILQSHYNLGQHQIGLNLIEQYQDQYQDQNIDIWKAWFYTKLNKPEESNQVFKAIFADSYSNDEDFFKYLMQLSTLKQYDEFKKLVETHQQQVNNPLKLKLTTSKMLIDSQSENAQTYLIKLFDDSKMVNRYQFKLLDYLDELGAYQSIIDLSKKRIEQGYESALLLNYLGDAQNALGDYKTALTNMQKAHKLSPDNSTIKSYYKSLLKKSGKSDLSSINDEISPVKIPQSMLRKISKFTPKHSTDSYEHLYNISAYQHVKNQKNKNTQYGKIKIHNESGVAKNKTFKFYFNQQYEKAYINYFRIFDAQGNFLVDLDKSTSYITTDNDGITADDDKTINIPVPSLSIGVIIEYAVTTEDTSKSDTQSFIDKVFVSSVSNQYKAVVFNGDINNIKVSKSADLSQHSIGKNTLYWDFENVPNYKKTPYLPDFQDIFPWLKFATVEDNWKISGDDYLSDIKSKINSDFSELTLSALYNETDDDITKAQAIIGYVQKNISYQAIEFGLRALIPNKAEETLDNKYGDCKDHAVLLHDMLNASGIKAQLALVNSSNDIAVDLPDLGQFNHMVVYLPDFNSGVFVDVTDKDLNFNLSISPYSTQGYHALVLQDKHSKLVQIPLSESNQSVIDVKRIIHKNEGHYIYQETGEISGYFASSFRDYLKDIELDELESRINSWVNNYYSDLILIEFEYKNLYDNSKPLLMHFKFSQEIEYATIKLPIFLERYAMEFSKSPKRLWGFEFKGAFEIDSQTVIQDNSPLRFKKGDYNVDTQLMKWNIRSTKNTIQFNSTVYSNTLPAAEYRKLVKQSKQSYKTLEGLLIDP